MKHKHARFAISVMIAMSVLLLNGCATKYMKGTPLYTGEYSAPQGPPEDRINLWPIMYYHSPALSLLWPMGEKTDDHLAVRPLFSMYKMDEEKHQYNVLWPIAQFDFDTANHRIFPFFWGGRHKHDRYFVLFPELWWFDDVKSILPLFWWDDGFCLFPILWFLDKGDDFCLFPLIWYERGRSFVLFPLVWYDKGNFFTVFPLYWYKKNKYCHFFPLWLHSKGKGGHDTYILWPIIRWQNQDHQKAFTIWPLYGRFTRKNGSHTYALWPLYNDKRSGTSRSTCLLPVYFREKDGDDYRWIVLPLEYKHQFGNDRLAITPLWCEGEDQKASWKMILPVFFARTDKKSGQRMTLTPLWSSGAKGEDRWSMSLPFYYSRSNDAKGTSSFITPLAGKTVSPGHSNFYFLPFLSTIDWGDKGKDIRVLAPFSRFQWGHGNTENYVFPLYSYNRNEKRFITPLVSWQNKKDEGFFNVLGIIAHYMRQPGGHRELDMLLSFANFKWGHGNTENYVFPLYSYNRNEKRFITPIVSWQNKEDKGFFNLLGLLAHYDRDGRKRNFHVLPPFSRFQWGHGNVENYVFPLYGYNRNKKRFITPIVSWQNKENDKFFNLLILLAHYAEKSGGRKSLDIIPPFGKVRWQKGEGCTEARLSPLFSWEKSKSNKSLWILPWFIYESRDNLKKNSLWPLWYYRKNAGDKDRIGERSDFNILGWLYDYRLRGPQETSEGQTEEYVRSRILWRVMHYERQGDHKTLDLFPFITYDSDKSDGFRKFSFAWRLIRYERRHDGGHDIDLFFLPIMRSHESEEALPEPAR